MAMFSPKTEFINHYDNLICQVDIDIEKCLEKHKEDELLAATILSTKAAENKNLGSDFGSDYRFVIRFRDSKQEKKEETLELWPESTKVVDYLNEIRMRTIDKLRKEQTESVENAPEFKHLRVAITDENKKEELKSELFANKFYFQAKITRPEYKKWLFNLVTFVTDFYMSPFEIDLLEKLINTERNELKQMFRDTKLDFEKMVQVGLLYKHFCDNFTTREFPNHMIHVSKQELSRIKHIKLKYPISGIDLNGSSSKLWNLEYLDLANSDENFQVNIENLPFLRFLRLKLRSVERITLNTLHNLRKLVLYINKLQTSLQADLCEQVPHIEKLIVKFDSLQFSYEYIMEEKKLSISFKSIKDIDFSPIDPISDRIEKLEINKSIIDSTKLVNVCSHFGNVFDLAICDSYMSKIEKRMFEGSPNLRSLSMHYNRNLETVDYDSFSDLKALVNLSLCYNFIESLDKRIFSDLVNLETLNVTENGIKSLDTSIFSNLKNLRELNLRSSEYEFLDYRLFAGLENLNELQLPGYKLVNFDLRILDNLPRLKKIFISKMSISHNETEILKRFEESGINFQFYK